MRELSEYNSNDIKEAKMSPLQKKKKTKTIDLIIKTVLWPP